MEQKTSLVDNSKQANNITAARNKDRHIDTIEFWRFFFAMGVALSHLEVVYETVNHVIIGNSYGVDFFFIWGGFMIANSAKKNLDQNSSLKSVDYAYKVAVDYALKKIKAIYPTMIVVVILTIFVYSTATWLEKLVDFANTEWVWFFLIGTPFGGIHLEDNIGFSQVVRQPNPFGPMWFLTVLILVGYIYTYAINRHYKFILFLAPVIGIISYIFYSMNGIILTNAGANLGIVTSGFIKCLAQMSFGIFTFIIYNRLSAINLGIVSRLMLSIIEIYAIYRFFWLTVKSAALDNFRTTPYLMLIILFAFWNVTIFSKIMNNKFSRILGKLSLTIYICHAGLIKIYFQLINWVRHIQTSESEQLLVNIKKLLNRTIGITDDSELIPLSMEDVLIFGVIVILSSVVINLSLKMLKHIHICYTRFRENGEKNDTLT